MIVNKSQFPIGPGYQGVTNLQNRFEQLQGQLATGKKFTSLSQMGSDRSFDLTVRSRLERIEGYSSNITTVKLRLNFFDNVLTRLNSLESEARTATSPGGYGSDGINLATAPTQSESQLSELVSLLNTDINGRYLFGGSKTDEKPVASTDALLNGAGGKDGFRTIAGERQSADAGADGLGRLAIAQVAAAVTLSEDGVHPFGFKLSTLSSDSAGITLTAPAGAPQSVEVEVTGPVLAGEQVRVNLDLPDGNSTTVVLTAVDGAPANPGEFSIGATATDTATSLAAGLQAALEKTATTDLAAASTFVAADGFFNGRGEDVMRVDGPPFDSATALKVADPADTVIWYTGEDATGSARKSVTARVDDSTTIDYGVQANEGGLATLVRSLAAMAIQNFPSGDESAEGRFDYISNQNRSNLAESNNGADGSIEIIALELGLAQSAVGQVEERQTSYKSQLQGMLAGIEEAPIEEVAMELNSIQVRLQASFQTMSMVSQLSLVNFI